MSATVIVYIHEEMNGIVVDPPLETTDWLPAPLFNCA